MAGVRNYRFAKMLEGIQISLKTTAGGSFDRYEITPIWKDVDRPNVGGYSFMTLDEELALRVVHCMVNGAFFSHAERAHDVHGKSYIKATSRVLPSTLDDDLRNLGY